VDHEQGGKGDGFVMGSGHEKRASAAGNAERFHC